MFSLGVMVVSLAVEVVAHTVVGVVVIATAINGAEKAKGWMKSKKAKWSKK